MSNLPEDRRKTIQDIVDQLVNLKATELRDICEVLKEHLQDHKNEE